MEETLKNQIITWQLNIQNIDMKIQDYLDCDHGTSNNERLCYLLNQKDYYLYCINCYGKVIKNVIPEIKMEYLKE